MAVVEERTVIREGYEYKPPDLTPEELARLKYDMAATKLGIVASLGASEIEQIRKDLAVPSPSIHGGSQYHRRRELVAHLELWGKLNKLHDDGISHLRILADGSYRVWPGGIWQYEDGWFDADDNPTFPWEIDINKVLAKTDN